MGSDTSLIFNLIAKDKATETIGKVKEKISTAAAGIAAGAGGALGAGIAASLDLSAASDKLAAQLGVGPAKAAELSKVSASVYKNAWGDSIDTVNTAVKGVYQNIGNPGIAEGGIEGITTKVLALAQTFDVDLGQTTASIGNMIKTGLVKNATEGLDLTTVAFQKLGDTGGDFLETMQEYSVQFSKVGLTGQKSLGLVNQMLQAGARDSDVAADAIKEFALEMGQGSSKARAGLQSVGLDADQIFKAFGQGGATADKAFSTVLGSLKNIENPIKRNALATQLFGTKAEDLGNALYAMDPSKAVASLGKVSGAADRMTKTIGDNPKSALETFKRSAQMKLAEIGGKFIQFGMEHQQFAQPMIVSLGVIAGLIMAVKAGTMAWNAAMAIKNVVTAAGTAAQWLFNAAMLANPIGLMIVGLIALGVGLVVLWKKSETFRNIVKGAFSAVWSAIKFVWDWTKKNWPLLVAILVGPFGIAVYTIVKNWGRIKGAGVSVWNWLKGLPGKIKSGFAKVGGWISAPFRAGFNAISRFWNGTAGRLSFRVPGWVPGIGGSGWSMPNLPYLAKGGVIRGAGFAVVGEAGPEVVHLPTGAAVSPLGRGGRQEILLRIDSDDAYLLRSLRKSVRTHGGNVQVVLGPHGRGGG
ncbi:phage tail tape measure protein [Actinomadura syzygii]|uniref:Phage tail tape measure protein n=1 Tax=Actinomadura syzygii TaxID=1427538 RepID=A0A5D0UB45_9ACTN|nr:phage tail tape measure protein [Actinomadura syzygii]TYC15010.1 phage tail tape measure protein [Actinomadura syzygii]